MLLDEQQPRLHWDPFLDTREVLGQAGTSDSANEANGIIPGSLNNNMKTLIQTKNACNNKDIDEYTNHSYPYYQNKVNKHYQ